MCINVTDERKHAASTHCAENFHAGAQHNATACCLVFGRFSVAYGPDSGVLFRPEIPLVIEPFFPNSTLVMVAVRRSVRRRAVL